MNHTVSTPANSSAPAASAPTFILDGIWGTHARWEGLRKRLTSGGSDSTIWRYDNSGFKSLEAIGAKLAAELAAVDAPFNLVGYSMGGLVLREAIRQNPGLPLRRAVVLNSPHNGTAMAWLLAPLRACREMQPGSAFLTRLASAPWSAPTLAVWCPGDLTVFPGHSARWDQATHHVRSDMPLHAWPIISQGIHAKVADFLAG